jgi:hypothetical protein
VINNVPATTWLVRKGDEKCSGDQVVLSFIYFAVLYGSHYMESGIEKYPVKRHNKNSTVLWDVMPYNTVEIYRRFGGNHCAHLQVGIVSGVISQQAEHCQRWRQYIPLKRC